MTRPSPEIVTVTLNAAIDQTATVPGFSAGTVNRVEREQSDAGGKGVNVASFLAHFGHRVGVTGLLGSDNQELFVHLFAEKGLLDRFVRVAGRTRVNVKIVDPVGNCTTDLNFPGVVASAADLAAVGDAVDALADAGARWFVLSGSVPAGIPATAYRGLTARLKARGCTVVLDTSGAALAAAVDAGADAIKPNIDELTELVGRPLPTMADVIAAARDLHARGVTLVAVSMGADGALFVDASGVVHARPPAVRVVSTVGAGDAMVAGIVHATLSGLTGGDRARLATAFSLGALGQIGPRLPARHIVEGFAGDVTITDPLT